MYDPEEDAKLLCDLKKVIKQKWNTYSEFDNPHSNEEIGTPKGIYISSSGLPISIDHLDGNKKRRLQANQYKTAANKIGPRKKRFEFSKLKTHLKYNSTNESSMKSDSDEDDKGRMSTILEKTNKLIKHS
ncbi:hypothetical protein BMR1_01G01885 [Babesia microti strain RI]|uniref:Uncharacterized protein n=1 Tax=Babesia microti (strain RI) TaxID=1133968 RepID=I7IPC0_BABMR|nr:hypothetical protein BMR1_01G01885 [Babesia microti strain RI]CCF72835.1 hypothetical protein BMR1_01G01885 [Babesia microti strain RI]|eukprot:XP_012647444.1 hypothetical protein BMR1_01G01885 [Babesia microti strain RI]